VHVLPHARTRLGRADPFSEPDMIAYPERLTFGRQADAQRHTYSPFFPVLQFNAEQVFSLWKLLGFTRGPDIVKKTRRRTVTGLRSILRKWASLILLASPFGFSGRVQASLRRAMGTTSLNINFPSETEKIVQRLEGLRCSRNPNRFR